MPSPIEQQLEILRQQVQALTGRVIQLEQRPGLQPRPGSGATVIPQKIKKDKRVPAYPGLRGAAWIFGIILLFFGGVFELSPALGLILIIVAIVWPWKITVPGEVSVPTTSTPTPPKPPVARVPSQFERDLAKHWFSWLGIISIVVGITLLLSYSLRDWGPLGRVITAYAASAMVFGLAAWFQRTYYGFGLILQSGGWALLFVATYALYAIPDAPLTDPLLVGWFLMIIVAAMAVAALRQHSRTLTAGAFLLGFFAAATNGVTMFTLSSLVLLAAGLVLVSTYQRWPQLVIIGNLATFVVHAIWLLTGDISWTDDFAMAFGFLVLEALIFGASHWITTPTNKDERLMVTGGTALNLTGVFLLLQYTISTSGNTSGWIATLFLAVVCAALAALTRIVPNRANLRAVYAVFAISFLTIGIGQKLKGSTLSLVWVVESAAVTVIGVLTRYRIMRLMGYLTTAIAVMAFLSFLPDQEFFGVIHVHSRVIIGGLAVLLYALCAWHLRSMKNSLAADEAQAPLVYGWIAIGLLTALLGVESNTRFVSIAWGIEGVILYAAGFALRQLSIRRQGLAVLVLTIAKVYLYDVGNLETGARILSFIILGVILLLIGYFYNRWRQQLRAPGPPPNP